jgi:transposase
MLVKIGKSLPDCIEACHVAYEEESPCEKTISKWYHKIEDGETDLNSKPHPGRPADLEKIWKIQEALSTVPWASIRMLEKETGIPRETVR